MGQQGVQQQLHSEIIDRAAEEHGGRAPLERVGPIERGPRRVEQGQLLDEMVVGVRVERIFHRRVVDSRRADRRFIGAAHGALVEMRLVRRAVVHSSKSFAHAHRPIDRKRVDLKGALDLVDQAQQIARLAIELVHESEDRYAAQTADLEKL